MNKIVSDVVASIKANAKQTYTDAQYAEWISYLDGEVSLLLSDSNAPIKHSAVTDEVYIPFPYDDIYIYYCLAQSDYFSREFEQYQNSYARYNARLEDFLKYKARTASGSSSGTGTSGSIGGTSAGAGDNHIIV